MVILQEPRILTLHLLPLLPPTVGSEHRTPGKQIDCRVGRMQVAEAKDRGGETPSGRVTTLKVKGNRRWTFCT